VGGSVGLAGGGSFPYIPPPLGQVAQLVEQRTENPRVGGSIPSLAMDLAGLPRAPCGDSVGTFSPEPPL
jgi:hypothetical protein